MNYEDFTVTMDCAITVRPVYSLDAYGDLLPLNQGIVALRTVTFLLTVLLLSSCARFPLLKVFKPSAPAPPAPSKLDIAKLDTSPLVGRKIVLDPGHGGRYSGAVGQQGVRESDVNLWVGLYLWGLLNQAGAEAVLTRTTDVDMGPTKNGELKDDLQPRVDKSNNMDADLFLSVHHNSNHNEGVNQTEVYYKMSDKGPSLDVARAIGRRMDEGLALGSGKVLPGNYYVLRNNNSPSVLGEASYLSNGDNERQLAFHATLRKEAEAYFMGILDYFASGVPTVCGMTVVEDLQNPAKPTLFASLQDGLGGGIDPATISLTVDGKTVSPAFDSASGALSWQSAKPLTNGRHTFTLSAKNRKGNSTRTTSVSADISLPPARVEGVATPSALPPDNISLARITARLVDANNNIVLDGTPVDFASTNGTLVATSAATVNGEATTYLQAPGVEGRADVTATAGEASTTISIDFRPLRESLIQLRVTDQKGQPLPKATLTLEDNTVSVSDSDGRILAETTIAGEHTFSLQRKGYQFRQVLATIEEGRSFISEVAMTPEEGGLLLGKIIALDPEVLEGSGEAEGNAANYRTALFLRERLEQAGVTVVMSRNGEPSVSVDRMARVNATEAELLVSIGHRKAEPSVEYYHLSNIGKRFAAIAGRQIRGAMSLKPSVRETDAFAVVHSRMPAVLSNFSRVEKKHENDSSRREADALYKALLEYFTP
ncbi:MAG: N-acetylmuramoyl-L-alanine amidase [Nitrospirota bacterium]|nr:N-acetylmuramoyl-L-alanine amidase [Nitrospirota bacterium]